MNIVNICISKLPEESRETAFKAQRESQKDGTMFSPYLTDECAEALDDEIMLTVWPKQHSFYFTKDDDREFVEVPESEYPLSVERAKWYLNNMKPWTQEIINMWYKAID